MTGREETKNPSADAVEPTRIEDNIRRVYEEALREPGGSRAALKLYGADLDKMPDEIKGFSFGCGNPVSHARLLPGMSVIDVGCGAGVDAIYAAGLVGPTGSVRGFDMTGAMVDKAAENAARSGLPNLVFEIGIAEDIPFGSSRFDVALSNAVIHLVRDKKAAYSEIFRVLKPDGRAVVADIMTDRPIPDQLRMEYLDSGGLFLYGGICTEEEYFSAVRAAGFPEVEILQRVAFDVMSDVERTLGSSGKLKAGEVRKAVKKLSKVGFFVNTIEARKTERLEKIPLPCACGGISTHDFYEIANVTVNLKLARLQGEGTLNTFRCPDCGVLIPYPRPFIYHDMARKIMVHVFPEVMREQRPAFEMALREASMHAPPSTTRIKLAFGTQELDDLLKQMR